jgi:mycothiol synthase
MVCSFQAGVELPSTILPNQHSLDHYVTGDEAEWISLLHRCGFSMFTGERAATALAREVVQFLLPQGGVFAYDGQQLVACAAACARPEFAPNAVLMYVGVLPDYRGAGLGAAVVAEVLAVARRSGFPGVTLLTDDDRLAAIRTYLRVGFVPDAASDPAAKKRWKRVMNQLASAHR